MLNIKSNSQNKQLVLETDLTPNVYNVNATAGPKLDAIEVALLKTGGICVLSFNCKVKTAIASGEQIFTLKNASIQNLGSFFIIGRSGVYQVRFRNGGIEAVDTIPAGDRIAGQIVYPVSW